MFVDTTSMLIAAMLALSHQSETSQAVYDHIVELTHHARTLYLDLDQATSDSWDKDAIITIRKPNKIYVFDGANVYKSDGRTVQTRRDKFVVRKATQDERKCITRQFQDLMRGFEAFYAPRANVKCVGASQPVAHRDDCVAINIIVDGTPCSIYVSNKTGLPISTQTEGKARRWYAQVKLGIPVKDQFFRESIKPRS